MHRILWFTLLLVACQSTGDTTPPTIASTIPTQGATEIALSTKLAIIFSEAIKQDSITVSSTPNINLGTPVFNDAKTAVFTPASGWQAGTSYTLSVEAKDLAGNALTGTKTLSFQSVAPPDTTAPATPTGVKATAGENEFFVDWNAGVEGDLAGYNLHFGLAGDALNNTIFIEKPAVVVKVSSLENGTTYFYALDAQDTSGNRSAKSLVGSVTPKDTTAPTLVSSEPANGTQDLTLVPNLRFVFSEPMNPGSLEIGFCIVLDPPASATCANPSLGSFGTPTWSEGDTTVQFSPNNGSGFQGGKTYVLVLVGKDKAGNSLSNQTKIAFALRATPDTTAPTVSHLVQVADPTAKITLTFSEAMNQQSVQTALLSQPSITCTWTWQGNVGTCATGALEQNTAYTITLGTGAKDTAGNAMLAPYQFSSTTPNFAPRVIRFSPTSRFGSVIGVKPNTPIVLTFSEAMNQTTAQDAFEVKVGSNLVPGTFEWDPTSTIMTFKPNTGYGFGSTVSWKIKTTAAEAGGRSSLKLVAEVSGSFTTELLIGK